ncbi:MAG: hypothetical protein H6817_09800 [Phycisphaerales bacterium]|nr:hypothetical protein [Phycisphaerales bacterium]
MVRPLFWLMLSLVLGTTAPTCDQGGNSTPTPDMTSNGEGNASGDAALAPGTWGGDGIRLVVREDGADFEFDCAMGETADPIKTDADGAFANAGEYTREQGGPVSVDDPPLPSLAAEYRGTVTGDVMRLTITLTATDEQIGPFELEKDKQAQLEKCL